VSDEPRASSHLSDRDRAMAQEIGNHAGQVVIARLIDTVTNREFAQRVTNTYAEEAQRIVGKAVIRFAFWVVGVVMLIVAWKTGVVSAISEAIGTGGGHRP